MAHWFHRNPIKATGTVTFQLRGVASTVDAGKICNDLCETRKKLLDLLRDASNSSEAVETLLNNYLSFFYGFIYAVDETSSADSKIRHIINFKWTQSLLGPAVSQQHDAYFEINNMLVNIALWYSKHALHIAATNENPSMDEAKNVHKSLRVAAGIFKFVKESIVSKLMEPAEKGSDSDIIVLEAYIQQCTAEAQEVTMARAMELKHSPDLISALAYETSKLFKNASQELQSVDPKLAGKWNNYLELKQLFYMAYAYSYNGASLLNQDKCGEAIRSLRESYKYYEKAELLCKDYRTIKGPGVSARLEEHLFFRRLAPHLKRTLEKCERENGMIYHEKVPDEVPELELKATYGLAAPEEFKIPSKSELWTVQTYQKFDITKMQNLRDEEKKHGGDKNAPNPVKEKEIPHSTKDPKNNSGCSIS